MVDGDMDRQIDGCIVDGDMDRQIDGCMVDGDMDRQIDRYMEECKNIGIINDRQNTGLGLRIDAFCE